MLGDEGGRAMSVSLTPDLEAMIRERVASGRYNDADEVVREALRLLQERDQIDHLRSLLAVAQAEADRGELIEVTPEFWEEMDRRVENRILRGEEPDPDVCP
jgi:antitoxin ParD1/3/4